MHHMQLSDIAERGTGESLLGPAAFATPWDTLDYLHIAPESEHRWNSDGGSTAEYGYLVLHGEIELHTGTVRTHASAPAVVRTLDPDHALVNGGSATAGVLAHKVTIQEHAPTLDVNGQHTAAAAVDPGQLQWRPAIHGGVGRIATRHIWGPDDLVSTWTFLDHAILAPESSVGYHHHEGLEESFIVLGGTGYVTIEDSCFEVASGSVTFQGIRQGHGIYNPADEELNFIRVAVAGEDGAFTTVDLHDDLKDSRP
jgi:mannose-6-phosphate isomerase-like protein (cupin superfamily)